MSVGREGVAVQLGGAIGGNMASNDFSTEKKQFFRKIRNDLWFCWIIPNSISCGSIYFRGC